MSISIEDQDTIATVSELASLLDTSPEVAVKQAVRAALDKLRRDTDFDKGLRDFYARFPKPTPTGQPADKAFFDELSGETD